LPLDNHLPRVYKGILQIGVLDANKMEKQNIDLDNLGVQPSYVDIKKGITLPTEYSENLAYFCGILAGDGHIELNLAKKWYRVHCAGNPADERELYNFVLVPLIRKLFHFDVKARLFSETYGFEFGSKLIVTFLTKILGLPSNNKYGQLAIPSWVKVNECYIKAYIRGLADTDFCLSLKKRHRSAPYYPVVSGVSKSKSYMEEIAVELEKLGFKVSRSFDVTRYDSRFKSGLDITHRIHIYGPSQLINWMKIIGFNSPKHLLKFEIWQNRNICSNRSKVKEALREAKLINKRGLETSPLN
jgi:hypothetical protein